MGWFETGSSEKPISAMEATIFEMNVDRHQPNPLFDSIKKVFSHKGLVIVLCGLVIALLAGFAGRQLTYEAKPDLSREEQEARIESAIREIYPDIQQLKPSDAPRTFKNLFSTYAAYSYTGKDAASGVSIFFYVRIDVKTGKLNELESFAATNEND